MFMTRCAVWTYILQESEKYTMSIANIGFQLSIRIETKRTRNKQECCANRYCLEDTLDIKKGDDRLVISWMDGGYRRNATYHPLCFLNVIVQLFSRVNINTNKNILDILARLL